MSDSWLTNKITHQRFTMTTTIIYAVLFAGMFDKDGSGTIDINEFQQLWTYMNQWKGTFERIDSNRSGSIESHELCAGDFTNHSSLFSKQ